VPYKFPAPPYACLSFFEDSENETGWSEFYWVQPAPAGGYASALSRLKTITTNRLTLCQSYIRCTGMRVSDANVKGDTIVEFLPPTANFGTYKGAVTDPLPSDDAVFCRLQGDLATPIAKSIRPIHAIPRFLKLTGSQRTFNPDAEWTTNFAGYKGALIEFAKLIRRVPPVPPATDPTFSVAGISDVIYSLQIRNRKIGRPFGLFRGRVVAR